MINFRTTGIYKLTNVVNGKIYIGQSKNIHLRMKYHMADSVRVNDPRGNYPMYDDMRKYGFENFKLDIIELCEEDELNELERKYILEYNSTDENIGYNLTAEAHGFKDRRIVKLTHSPEIMKKHGERLRKWNLKQWQDAEYIKMKSEFSSKLQKERLKDPEYLAIKTSQLKKATDKMKKRVGQYSKDGTLIAEFDGIREAGRKTGIDHNTIQKVANKEKYRKTAGGYVWKYL